MSSVIAFGSVLPVAYLFVRSSGAWPEILDLFIRPRTILVFGRTALLISIVALFSTVTGALLSWLTIRTNMPLRRPVALMAVLPLVIPSFILAATFIDLYGPRAIVQGWLEPLGVDRLPSLYGLIGSSLTLTIATYPYTFLTVTAALRRIDPSLEEAARAMGMGRFRVFAFVTLPLLRSALASGALLAALYTLSDFGAVSLMRYETLTASIFLQYESFANRALAAGLSLPLIGVALIILSAEGFTRGRRAYHRTGAGTPHQPREIDLGGWALPMLVLATVPIVGGLMGPVGVLGGWLWNGIASGSDFIPLAIPLWNSVRVSLIAGGITVVAALPVAALSVRYPGVFSSIVEKVIYIGFGLPGVVVALGIIFFGVNVVPFFYQSIWLLVAAYVMLFLPVPFGALRTAFLQINPHLEEAAAGLGAGRLTVLRRVILPIITPGAVVGIVLVFILSMKELPATLLLSPIGFKTLATAIWSSTSEAFFAQTAAACLLLIAVSLIPAVQFLFGRYGQGRV